MSESSPNDPRPPEVLSFVNRPLSGSSVRLKAVGDLSTSGRIAGHLREYGDSAGSEVLRMLADTDLLFANLECVVGSDVGAEPFVTDSESVTNLGHLGFKVLNLANNHVIDRGQRGVLTTLEAVEAGNMVAIGVNRGFDSVPALTRTDRNGLRIGWLASGRTLADMPSGGPWIWEFDEDQMINAVKKARAEVDVLILSLHIGFMLVEYPAPEIREVARRIAASGADLILMHHPHVLQGVEVTDDGRVICYSLGNFLFDWREGKIEVPVVEDLQRQGGIFDFKLDREGVAAATFRPTALDDECRVVWPGPETATEICARVERLSRELGTDYSKKFALQRAERNTSLGVKLLVSLLNERRFGEFARQVARIRPRHAAMVARRFFVRRT